MEAAALFHDMKEEYVVDESEPAAFSTLSIKKKTAMSKHLKDMAILCFIYDEDFRNLAN